MKTSIYNKMLALLVFSVILAGVLVSVNLISISREALYLEIHEKQLRLGERIGDRIWNLVKAKRLVVQCLANNADFIDMDTPIMAKDIVRLMERDHCYMAISVVSGLGKEIIKKKIEGDRIVDAEPVDRTSGLEFKISIRGRGYISPVYIPTVEGPYLIISTPIKNTNKEVVGIILAEVCLKGMQDVISEINVGRRGYAFVVDNRGRLIAHPNKYLLLDQEKNLFTDIQIVRHTIAGKKDILSAHDIYTSETGTKVFGVQSQIKELGWGVIVQQPLEEISQPIKQMFRQSLIWSFVTIIIILVIGYFVIRALIRPILILSQVTKLIAKGDLNQRANVSSRDEIGELAASFNKMVGDLKESNSELRESEEQNRDVLRTALDGFWVADIEGRILEVNDAYCNLIGYSREELLKMIISDVEAMERPEDTEKHIQHIIETGGDRFESKHRCKDGRVIDIDISTNYVNVKGGRFFSFIRDITERIKYEKQIKVSLREKEVLLKEIHHRVKNNMQIMVSLLRLQSEEIEDKHLLGLFNESQNRIKSMALVHEDLYQGKDLGSIDFERYVRKLTGRLMKAFGVDPNRIITSVNIDNAFLGVDKAIPCGLILNELFTNSLKHAFPHIKTDVEHIPEKVEDREQSKNKGEIRIVCHFNSDEYTLVFSDNGVGLSEGIDIQEAKTMGLDLVKSLTQQLEGTIEINRKDGTEFTITFKV